MKGTLGKVAIRIAERLRVRGYENFLYYEVPGGFAVATELERFDDRGQATGGEMRFERGPLGGWYGFVDLFKKIFVGEDGHYRVFIFVVTDTAFPLAADPAIEGDVRRWGTRGSLYLPKSIASKKTDQATAATLLVYEFAEDHGKDATLTAPRRPFVSDQAHLRWLGFAK